MGENCRIEDLTITLTSSEPVNLTAIELGGTTSQTSKIRTCVINVNNSSVASASTTNVYGLVYDGSGSLNASIFSFNSIKGSTVNVYSNGAGNKRGILVSGTNQVSTRDTNVYVAAPTDLSGSTGSYVGIETNDSSGIGSIQLRTTTAGVVFPIVGNGYTASDILQSTPAIITNPTYLASAGIQIGPGVDLVTKSAGGKGFSTYIYPTTIFYGLKGNIHDADTSGYLWPGTQQIQHNQFPDTTDPPAYYRIQQPALLSGIYASLNTAPGATYEVTISVKCTPNGGSITTIYDLPISGTSTTDTYYSFSYRLNTGDKIHVQMSYTDSKSNAAQDLTVQLDMF